MAASGDYTPKTIYVLYKDGATVKDIVESYAHVFEIRLLASSILPSIPEGSDVELAYNEFYIKAARAVLDTPGTVCLLWRRLVLISLTYSSFFHCSLLKKDPFEDIGCRKSEERFCD